VKRIEEYMEKHGFLPADRKKVRDFLREQHATDAYLTRDCLYFRAEGIPGVIGRVQLGIQENFI